MCLCENNIFRKIVFMHHDCVTVSTYQFFQRFPDAETAQTFLEQQRWSGEVTCPHCGEIKRVKRRKVAGGYFRCFGCKQDFYR